MKVNKAPILATGLAVLSLAGPALADVNFAKDAGPTLDKTRGAATNCIAQPNGMCALPSKTDGGMDQERFAVEQAKQALATAQQVLALLKGDQQSCDIEKLGLGDGSMTTPRTEYCDAVDKTIPTAKNKVDDALSTSIEASGKLHTAEYEAEMVEKYNSTYLAKIKAIADPAIYKEFIRNLWEMKKRVSNRQKNK